MATRTLLSLREEVRERADMEDDGNFISDAELNRYINRSIEDLWDLVLDSAAGEVFVKNAPILTQVLSTPNVGTYQLPSDFYKMRGIHLIEGESIYELEKIDADDYAVFANDPPTKYCGTWTFKFEPNGTKYIHTFPEQDPNYLAITYIPESTRLSLDADTFDGYNGWEDYVVVKAAIKCLAKEESEVGPLLAELDDIKKAISSHAGYFDASRPPTIRNRNPVYGLWRKYRGD